MYNGSVLALASVAFKANLNSISGFNAAGTGYTSYRPTSTFNSLTQLAQDGVYIVDAKTTGFDIPGAVLTAVPAIVGGPVVGPGPMTFQSFSVFRLPNTEISVDFEIWLSDRDEDPGIVYYDKDVSGLSCTLGVGNAGNIVLPPFQAGTPLSLTFVNRDGYKLVKQFVAPV